VLAVCGEGDVRRAVALRAAAARAAGSCAAERTQRAAGHPAVVRAHRVLPPRHRKHVALSRVNGQRREPAVTLRQDVPKARPRRDASVALPHIKAACRAVAAAAEEDVLTVAAHCVHHAAVARPRRDGCVVVAALRSAYDTEADLAVGGASQQQIRPKRHGVCGKDIAAVARRHRVRQRQRRV
jgi:hypothetical protein